MTETEKRALTKRLTEGRRRNFQNYGKTGGIGKSTCGVAPYGYVWIGDQLEVDEMKATWVRHIHQLRAEGLSLARIKRQLDAHGIITNWGLPFSRQAILNILNNPFYRGSVSYAGFIIEGHHQPII